MVDWRSIPGNPEVFKELVSLLTSGQAVGFVGAGASAGLYPLWPKLIEQLADRAVAAGADRSLKAEWCTIDALQAARQIRKKLGEGPFAAEIRRTFGPKKGSNGKPYTATHAALARLGFRAYVTTNYDSALTSACREIDKREVHPFDWREDDVTLWLQGDHSNEPDMLPILHAHGRYNAKESLVLDAKDFRRAYGNDRYRSLFEKLWTSESLVVIGFSLDDPWLRIIAEQALSRAHAREVSDRRHVALIGLPEDKVPVVEVHRDAIEEPYHLRALFYPTTQTTEENGQKREDHSALGSLLEELLEERSTLERIPSPVAAQSDPLKVWFQQVRDEHRHLDDGFDRPPELQLLEKAWVQVRVQPGLQKTAAVDGAGHELLGKPMVLDEVLELPPGKPSWNQGRWLLEGPPGSGKTTLLRRLAARLAEEKSPQRVPVFVSLPRLVESGKSLLDHAADGLELTGTRGLVDALSTAGREGRLVLLLDSYDEVPRERRKPVLHRLLAQLRRSPLWRSCRLVVSSRPISEGKELEDLPRLALLPLDEEHRRQFLETWLRHAGRSRWKEEASETLDHFDQHRGLRDLSANPLYLTLLSSLCAQGIQPSAELPDLYDQVFELLLEGTYREDPRPMPNQPAVLEALRHLAHGMTEDDLWAEPAKKLEARLRPQRELCTRLGHFEPWRDDLRAFLRDVHERTLILGPHDGRKGDWRFWHRTFREALTAEHLRREHEESGPEALMEWAARLEKGGEGRWAEPLNLLAGRLESPDELIGRLAEVNPRLSLRASTLAGTLKAETIVANLGRTRDLEERTKVFEGVPDQLADADACLALVEQLRQGCRNGFDLFWLWWITEEVGRRWPDNPRPGELLARFFEHIPSPEDPELLWTLDTPLARRVNLWQEIPAGTGWVGSPEDEEGRDEDEGPLHKVEILRPFWLGAGPVTNAQYAAFDPDKPFQQWKGVPEDKLATHPRVGVTWYEAVSFCRWLATLPGFTGTAPRLPVEEEWEYACRAGTPSRFWEGDSEADLEAVGWFAGNGDGRTHRVGGKAANAWHLYDVHGNAWEWTATPWDAQRYEGRSLDKPHPIDPTASAADLAGSPRGRRVMRGGSCRITARICRSAYRDAWDPGFVIRNQGFRVLLSSAPSRDRS